MNKIRDWCFEPKNGNLNAVLYLATKNTKTNC